MSGLPCTGRLPKGEWCSSLVSSSSWLRWFYNSPSNGVTFKLNSGAACGKQSSSTSLGFLVKGDGGAICAAGCRFCLVAYPPLLAELLAIREGLQYAISLDYTSIYVESDSLTAISLIMGLRTLQELISLGSITYKLLPLPLTTVVLCMFPVQAIGRLILWWNLVFILVILCLGHIFFLSSYIIDF